MYNNKRIGVVILNYNDSDTTIVLCEKIVNYISIDNVVVVDNMSTDNSYQILEKNLCSEKITLLMAEKNGGYSYGNNLGVFYAIKNFHVDFIIIANPDVEFDEHFVEKTIEDLISEKYVAMSGVMLDDSKNCSMSIKMNSYWDDVKDCYAVRKKIKNKGFPKDVIIDSDLLPGSLFVITANAFLDISGFDENVFLYCEERILATKLKEKNYFLGIDTSISFIHHHAVSINKSIKYIKQRKLVFKSRLYYNTRYRKIGKFKYLILVLSMKIGLLLRRIYFLFV